MDFVSVLLSRIFDCRLFVLVVCLFVGGCVSSVETLEDPESVDSLSSVLANSKSDDLSSGAVIEDPEADDSSPLVVRTASGYLRELLDTAHGPEDVMIAFREGPSHALNTSDFVVAGYLFGIVPGATIIDTSEPEIMTPAQQRAMSDVADQLERRFRTDSATEGDWQELQRMRDNISRNSPSKSYVLSFWTYRIRITEVMKGEFSVDDILEIQIYAGTNLDSGLRAQVLEGTPRVVVAGKPGSPTIPNYELRDSEGEVVDQVNWSYPDVFWFDEGVWEILVDDTTDGVSVTEEPDATISLPSELSDDETSEINTGAALEDSSVVDILVAESHYLRGLHEMDPRWGELNSLDDLANALRGAAASVGTTPTTTVASTTTAPSQP